MNKETPVTIARPGQMYRMKKSVTDRDFLKRYPTYRSFISSISNGQSFTLTRFKNNRTSLDGEGQVDVFVYKTNARQGLEMAISNQMIQDFFVKVETMKEVVIGRRYRHISTGNEYLVLHLANIADPKPGYPIHVVYIGDNGNVWTKTLEEFKVKFTYDE